MCRLYTFVLEETRPSAPSKEIVAPMGRILLGPAATELCEA